ncbi:hypothetical protein AKJ16_DCAP13361 [Drosera capensis]
MRLGGRGGDLGGDVGWGHSGGRGRGVSGGGGGGGSRRRRKDVIRKRIRENMTSIWKVFPSPVDRSTTNACSIKMTRGKHLPSMLQILPDGSTCHRRANLVMIGL